MPADEAALLQMRLSGEKDREASEELVAMLDYLPVRHAIELQTANHSRSWVLHWLDHTSTRRPL